MVGVAIDQLRQKIGHLPQDAAKKLTDAGYHWAKYSGSSADAESLEQNAAGLGVEVIMPEVEVIEEGPFEYWPEADEAIATFTRYLSDQWIYSFGGIAALDVSQALAVIDKLHKKPVRQLRLLEEVKAFASGVLKHFYEQQKKS
ncbi:MULTISPECIES: DUF1799 domain-containing protein [Methylobacter]